MMKKIERADLMVVEGMKDEAVKYLYEQILKCASERKFDEAETLREKLLDVDSMALTEITRSGEFIEHEKQSSIDKDHLELWPGLYENLSMDEINALFYSLEEKEYYSGEYLTRQGKTNAKLFFIAEGEVKVVFSRGDEEILVTTLRAGDVAGEDSFFPISVCTVSVVALNLTRVHVLNRENFKDWQNDFPALERRIEVFCRGINGLNEYLDAKGIERRAYGRVDTDGPVEIQLLNREGKPLKRAFRGHLADISLGGVSIMFKNSNKDNARLLLGRRIRMRFSTIVGKRRVLAIRGAVMGVCYHMIKDYSLHVRFDNLIDEDIVQAMDSESGN